MKSNFKSWLKAAVIRAIRTIAQTAIATIGSASVLGDVNWVMVASASVLSGVLSILMSIAGLPEVQEVEATPEVEGNSMNTNGDC